MKGRQQVKHLNNKIISVMKRIFFLFIGALIVGFVIFAISFWLFRADFNMATSFAIGGAGGGLFVELIKKTKTKESSQ